MKAPKHFYFKPKSATDLLMCHVRPLTIILLSLGLAVCSIAGPLESFGIPEWTFKNKVFKKVRFGMSDPRFVTVLHEKGTFSILWDGLSPDLKTRFEGTRASLRKRLEDTPKMWLTPAKLDALWGKGEPSPLDNDRLYPGTKGIRWMTPDFTFLAAVYPDKSNAIWACEVKSAAGETWNASKIESTLITLCGPGWKIESGGNIWKNSITGNTAEMKSDTITVLSKILIEAKEYTASAKLRKWPSAQERIQAKEDAKQQAERRVTEALAAERAQETQKRAADIQKIRDLEAAQKKGDERGEKQ